MDAQTTYSASPGFTGLLAELGVSLAVSSYQSGKLFLLGQVGGRMTLHERHFQRAMGLCASGDSLLMASLYQIHHFRNMLRPGQRINTHYDRCYVPRTSHTTGVLDIHDIGQLADGRIVFVNTMFNCLATLSERHSFKPLWKPSFISDISAGDRCHLNGMAVEEGKVRYVTAVSTTDTPDSWREQRVGGGVVIDVQNDAIICRGLSMPHSPRLHHGKLWLLNAGTGELGFVEQGAFMPVAFAPGFGRGLAFAGNYAFIGLSKPRYQRFEGLPIGDRLLTEKQEARCGVHVIDTQTGRLVEWFHAEGAVIEIFDVATLTGTASPMSLGFQTDEILSLVSHEPL